LAIVVPLSDFARLWLKPRQFDVTNQQVLQCTRREYTNTSINSRKTLPATRRMQKKAGLADLE